MPRTAVLLGATGLVGGHVVRLLVEDPECVAVTLLVRRAVPVPAPKVRAPVVDFERPESFRPHLAVDDVYCCLGTTLKAAGSEEAFRRVDHDYPVALARAAREAGATRLLIVTAVGADPKSRVFYNRVKGETEAELSALGFPRGLTVARPSMLLGERPERRPAEAVGRAVMGATRGLFRGALARYRAIDAADVARALVASARRDVEGVEILEGEALFARAREVIKGRAV